MKVCGSMLRKILVTTYQTPIIQNFCSGKYNSSCKRFIIQFMIHEETATVVAYVKDRKEQQERTEICKDEFAQIMKKKGNMH